MRETRTRAELQRQLFEWYDSFENEEHFAKVASLEDLFENDFSLNIQLYVEKIIEDNLPSVEEAQADLKTDWDASLNAEGKFKMILKNYIQLHIERGVKLILYAITYIIVYFSIFACKCI
jgi:type I restriction-modification system DNA methylase subunit